MSGAAINFSHVPVAEATVVALQMDVEASAAADADVPGASTFGKQDTWRLNIFAGGGFAIDDDKDTAFGIGGVGVSYFLIDNVSIDLELVGLGISQPVQDAAGLGFNVLVRWHFIAEDTWSIYVDGGAGMLGTTANVPPGTTSFNFTPQAGFGASIEIADDTRLFVGVRAHHISNANIGDQNFGLDNFMAYAGVSFPF